MLRKILTIIGRLWSYICPYSLCHKIQSCGDIIYTAWASRGFRHFATTAKMGRGMRLAGIGMIEVEERTYIGRSSTLTAFAPDGKTEGCRIRIGRNCMLGDRNFITACNRIEIGDGVLTGEDVLISDNGHGDRQDIIQDDCAPKQRKLYSKGAIRIGNHVWIGEHAAILAGVTIGDGAVIGANAVVTHDVPSHSIAVGNPAKIIELNHEQ